LFFFIPELAPSPPPHMTYATQGGEEQIYCAVVGGAPASRKPSKLQKSIT